MNAYFVDAGEHRYVAERIDGWPRYEAERFVELVVAPSRERAKSLFLRRNARHGIEFTDIKSVRLVKKGVDYPEGVVRDDVVGLRLWAAYSRLIGDVECAEEEERLAAELEERLHKHGGDQELGGTMREVHYAHTFAQ